MTVLLLGYAETADQIVAGMLGLGCLVILTVAFWPEIRARRRPSPRPMIRPVEPRSNVKPLGPRPYDWQRDEPRHSTRTDVAGIFRLDPELFVHVDETPLLERR